MHGRYCSCFQYVALVRCFFFWQNEEQVLQWTYRWADCEFWWINKEFSCIKIQTYWSELLLTTDVPTTATTSTYSKLDLDLAVIWLWLVTTTIWLVANTASVWAALVWVTIVWSYSILVAVWSTTANLLTMEQSVSCLVAEQFESIFWQCVIGLEVMAEWK